MISDKLTKFHEVISKGVGGFRNPLTPLYFKITKSMIQLGLYLTIYVFILKF